MILRDSRNTPKVDIVINLKPWLLLSVSLFTWLMKKRAIETAAERSMVPHASCTNI